MLNNPAVVHCGVVHFLHFLRPADSEIYESMCAHLIRVVDISCIEDKRPFEKGFDAINIRALEHIPLRYDDEAISAVQRIIRIVGIVDTFF